MSLVRGLFGAVLLVLTAAVAAGGALGDGPQTAALSQLDAAATDAQTLAETTITTLDVPTTTRSVVPRVVSTITASTVRSRTVESQAPVTTRPTMPGAVATVTTAPGAVATVTTPAPVKPISLSSWTAQANGITVTARIEPAAPRAGDTVTIFWTMTTTATRTFCCFSLVTANGAFVGETGQSRVIPVSGQPLDPCPTGRVPSGVTTFVAPESGVSTLTIRAHAMDKPCDFSYVDLSATFHVGPAGE